MCDDCAKPTITRRQALWVPPAALGAALVAQAPSEATSRTVELVCRPAWGARPATGPYVTQEVSHITLHHSAVVLTDNRKAPAQVRAFQADHQSRGWPNIAYHLLVDRHGNVYQGRPTWTVGDTNTSYDPSGHLLVLAMGNFQTQEMTSAQLDATVNVLAWACSRHGIAPRTIRGHRTYATTLCPGDRFQRYVTDGTVRQRVAGRLGTVTLKNLSGDAGLRRVRQIESGTD